jgi:transketolase
MCKKVATREAYGKALKILAEKNENVVVLDADLSKSTKTAEFQKVSPERFINCGIAEQNLMATSAGLAAAGKIPFASTFAVFAAGRAFEIIRNSIAYPKMNVKVAATHAGLTVGEDGASHQAIEDISLMRTLPNMTVINPADAKEAEKAVLAVSEYNGPVYLRFGRMPVPQIFDDSYKFEIGKGVVIEEGKDITIFATGIMVAAAMEANEILKTKGISAEIINIHTIKPIDSELIINSANKTKKVLTCEEHSIIGGLGSAVSEVLSENAPCLVKRMGVNDTFGESGKGEDLLVKYGLTANDIVIAVENMLK